MNFRFISAKENNLHFKECFVRHHLHQLGFMVSVEPQTRKKSILDRARNLLFSFSPCLITSIMEDDEATDELFVAMQPSLVFHGRD